MNNKPKFIFFTGVCVNCKKTFPSISLEEIKGKLYCKQCQQIERKKGNEPRANSQKSHTSRD